MSDELRAVEPLSRFPSFSHGLEICVLESRENAAREVR